MVCFHCGRYGHTKDNCLLKKEAEDKEKPQVDLNSVPNDGEHESGGEGSINPVPKQGVDREDGSVREEANNGKGGIFGPWMTVSRPKRGKNQTSRRNGVNYGGTRVKGGIMEGKGGMNTSKSRFDVLHNVGDRMEEIMGLGNKEPFIEGWSTDQSERNISRSVNGKEVVVDRAPWKPDVPQNSPIIRVQAQMGEGSSKNYHFSNPVFDNRPNANIGPKVVNGPSRNMILPQVPHYGTLGSSHQLVEKGLPQLTHQKGLGIRQPRVDKGSKFKTPNFGKPPDANTRYLASVHGDARETVNGGGRVSTAKEGATSTTNADQVTTVVGHGVAVPALGLADDAAGSRMEVEESFGARC
ncbi:uncharacterized protein G2W53_011041 [Senna tora]|uniref:CCHC-type domain-containing protein n=1 Tax=Senna tora TaxID=362788 RepID=A0A834X0T2_9FABA|nr:uncharacterized protein G2W53_011041 [Senna tora]